MTQAEKPHRGVGSPAERLRDLADEVTERLEAVARELGDAPTRSSKADQLRGVAGFIAAVQSAGPEEVFEPLRSMLSHVFDHDSHPEGLRRLARWGDLARLREWRQQLYAEAARLDGWEIDHNGTARRPDPLEGVRLPTTGEHVAAVARTEEPLHEAAARMRGVAGFVAVVGSDLPRESGDQLREILADVYRKHCHESHPLGKAARSGASLDVWVTALVAGAEQLDAAAPKAEPPTDDDPLPMRRLVNVLEGIVVGAPDGSIRNKLKDLVRRQRKDCPYHNGCIHADDLFKVKELLEGRTVTLATTTAGVKALRVVEAFRQKHLATVDVAKQVEQELRAIAATVLPLDSARIHAVADKLAEVNGRREEKPSVPLTNIPTYLRATLEESEQAAAAVAPREGSPLDSLQRKLARLRNDCTQLRSLVLIASLQSNQSEAQQQIAEAASAIDACAAEVTEELRAAAGAGSPPPCAVFRPSQRAEVLKLLDEAAGYSTHYAFRALITAIRKIVTA